MKIIRFVSDDGRILHGVPHAHGLARVIDGSVPGPFTLTSQTVRIQRLLAPIVPTAILGIGCNYHALAAHLKVKPSEYPITFFKLGNTVQDPDGAIELPRSLPAEAVDYEAELAVVIGQTCKNVPVERALDVVFGYTCANDVTCKDWQRERVGNQWCVGKGFDTFCPLGPAIVTTDEIPDPQALHLIGRLNGRVVQDTSTSDMIHQVRQTIAFLSSSHTLPAGAVILTGTPLGTGSSQNPARYLQPGDVFEVEIPQIGVLRNPVVAESLT
jgi:2-keto-4-pentenoate hydratase/2-oxohepta-3-ene-1,7-dioic acid hydratase in catechol pathway